jgi:hypothetical protein
MVKSQARLRAADVIGDEFNTDDVRFDPTGPSAEKLEMAHAIGRATTLVMAIACWMRT